MASLPLSVQAQGVIVEKKSTAILQIVSLTSPDGTFDSLYMSNYATINLVNELARLPGVGSVKVFGADLKNEWVSGVSFTAGTFAATAGTPLPASAVAIRSVLARLPQYRIPACPRRASR